MNECCDTCNKKMKLIKLDYSQGGCIHTDYDGFACLALAFDDGNGIEWIGYAEFTWKNERG